MLLQDTDLQPLMAQTEGSKPFLYREYYSSRIRLTWGNILDKDGEGKQLDVDSRLTQYLTDLDAANDCP